MEEKLQKIYLIYYNLLIAQDLWQAYYKILSMIFLRIKCKYRHDDEKCEPYGIEYNYCHCFFEHAN